MERIARLWRRSPIATMQVVSSVLLLLAFALLPLYFGGAQYLQLAVAAVVGLAIPYFFRHLLVPSQWLFLVFRFAPLAFGALLFFYKDEIIYGAPAIQVAMLAAWSLYISVFFFVMSR